MSDRTDWLTAVEFFTGTVATMIALPLQVATNAWALWALWGWFGEPLVGVPIGYWHAGGLYILLGFLRRTTKTSDEDYTKTLVRVYVDCLFVVPVAVLLGWLVQGLMP